MSYDIVVSYAHAEQDPVQPLVQAIEAQASGTGTLI